MNYFKGLEKLTRMRKAVPGPEKVGEESKSRF